MSAPELVQREEGDSLKQLLTRVTAAPDPLSYVDLSGCHPLDLKLDDAKAVEETFDSCPASSGIRDLQGEGEGPGQSGVTQGVTDGESDDDEVTIVLSEGGSPRTLEDESHFITTHEMQLLELDHDADYDLETASSWDLEDDHQVYSFVDYAFFDSDESSEGKETSARNIPDEPGNQGSKTQSSAGQIHLSIKAAVHEPNRDINRLILKGVSAKADGAGDSAKCFIALPGRLHFGSKRKHKDPAEHSSGASSAVSELDDADKEVRNLTARAFKSLAYPYFNAINFSTSGESSASEQALGINSWSTFVDLKYGSVSKARHHSALSQNSSTSNFHFAKKRDCKGIAGLSLGGMRAPPVEIFALNGNLLRRKNASSATKKMELMGKFPAGSSGLIRLTETLNFRCNVKSGQKPPDESVGGSGSTDEVTNAAPSAQASEGSNAEDAMDDTHKKAVFASSLLKNVISKKMQFEQERKMERGEISEAPRAPSPRQPVPKTKAPLQRQGSKFSEADSDLSVVSVEQPGDEARAESVTSASETSLETAGEARKEASEASAGTLLRSQNSAFRSWRDGEIEFQKEHQKHKTRPHETSVYLDPVANHTKMSHLFVPSMRLSSPERDARKPAAGSEIKITSHPLNVAKLLAPKAEPSEKVPHFIVRDIRDHKGKLQTPIHQVRDVRKLVKSSYHFVSLDGGDKSDLKQSPRLTPAPPSPIVIKCQSVNTHGHVRKSLAEPSQRRHHEGVAPPDRSSPQPPATSRAGLKTERQDKTGEKSEPKLANQAALEKLQAAVKTMEQLYVFDKNEWKRKSQPGAMTGSHVLTLLSGEDEPDSDASSATTAHTDRLVRQDSGSTLDTGIAEERDGHRASGKSVSHKKATPACTEYVPSPVPPNTKGSSVKQPLPEDRQTEFAPLHFTSTADSENYLTIPVKPRATPAMTPSAVGFSKTSVCGITAPGRKSRTHHQADARARRDAVVMEARSSDTPTATIYHTPLPVAMPSAAPQVFCFSPVVQPSPVPSELLQHTQRKMLLDPSTGNYYWVDTPVQPATRRLFDPETGQYVDVPVHQPPVTPVPLPISPLALNTYMFYPGYVPTTMIPARGLQSGADAKARAGPREEGVYMESPYYVASSQTPGLTSQHAPRIIAPPSFDGTTMSFVVEHR